MIDPGKVIESLALFRFDQKLLIAVSGGVDSMVLSKVMIDKGYQVGLAHVNYKLRAEESDLDANLVRDFALEHNVAFHYKEYPLTKTSNIQEEARKVRYDYFEQLKSEFGYQFLLTAHHADDRIEGFFLHLSRGSGIKGLSGMYYQSGNTIRPFLAIRKEDLLEYAIACKIPFRHDKSNLETTYNRNFIRNEILPLCIRRFPSFDEMVLRSIDHLQVLHTYFEQHYQTWHQMHIAEGLNRIEFSKKELETPAFLSYFLSQEGFHPNTVKDILRGMHPVGSIFNNNRNGKIVIDREKVIYEYNSTEDIQLDQEIHLGDRSVQSLFGNFKLEYIQAEEICVQELATQEAAVFDADQLKFPLQIRHWNYGDRISPFGKMKGTRKLKDVFADKKIDLLSKKRIPVFCSGNEIIWVPGLVRSNIAVVVNTTKKVLRIQLEIRN